MPIIGRRVRFVSLGGNLVGENALLRFYVLHCVVLPLIAIVLVAVHFWRVQKDGGLTVPGEDGGKGN
jgi:quinol-cytochrome oxidoreductase complex cytochrome b subunit